MDAQRLGNKGDLATEVEGGRSRGIEDVQAEKTCVPYRG